MTPQTKYNWVLLLLLLLVCLLGAFDLLPRNTAELKHIWERLWNR